MNIDYNCKVILVGESGVGKSCILRYISEKKFYDSNGVTIGADFSSKIFKCNNKNIKVLIWDTAGQEAYRSLIRTYYKNSSGVVIVFDLTDLESFRKLQYWLEELKENANEHVKKIIVGNKSDEVRLRVVGLDQIDYFCKRNSIEYIEISCKSGSNVENVFINLTARIMDSYFKIGDFPGVKPSVMTSNSRCPVFLEKTKNKRSDCC